MADDEIVIDSDEESIILLRSPRENRARIRSDSSFIDLENEGPDPVVIDLENDEIVNAIRRRRLEELERYQLRNGVDSRSPGRTHREAVMIMARLAQFDRNHVRNLDLQAAESRNEVDRESAYSIHRQNVTQHRLRPRPSIVPRTIVSHECTTCASVEVMLRALPIEKVKDADHAKQLGACPICLMDYKPRMLLRRMSCSCSHVIHKTCFDSWLRKRGIFRCPLDNLSLVFPKHN